MNEKLKEFIKENVVFYGEEINADDKKTTVTLTLQEVVNGDVVRNLSKIQGFGPDEETARENAENSLMEYINLAMKLINKVTLTETTVLVGSSVKYTLQISVHDLTTSKIVKSVNIVENDKNYKIARGKAISRTSDLLGV